MLFQIFGTEIITGIEKEVEEELVTLEQRMVGEEVTVCSIKTGVDDFLDFLAVTVTLLIPILIGTLRASSLDLLDIIMRISFILIEKQFGNGFRLRYHEMTH